MQMLLEAMRAEAREPKPAVLGAVGNESLRDWLAGGFAHHVINGVDNGIPWRWKIAFACLPHTPERVLLVAQNFSPAIDADAMLAGAVPWLSEHLAWSHPIALVAHRISPDRRTLDYGKTRLSLAQGEAWRLGEAIHKKVAAQWIKFCERVHRNLQPSSFAAKPPRRMSARDAV
jgi:hypothetical protein